MLPTARLVPPTSTPELWLELREQFAKLANEEQSEVGPGYDPYIRATVFDDDEGIRIWNLTKRTSNERRDLRLLLLGRPVRWKVDPRVRV